MFKPEDFELALEKKLRLQVIKKEVEECTDVDELKKQLIQMTEVFMKYQQLLNVVLAKQVEESMRVFANTIEKELNSIQEDGSSG